jgi:di/tricarboxylate transporter
LSDTQNQIILFSLLGVVFTLLIWGRIRYDLVAFGALVAAVILGVVPQAEAFSGFGHPATIIIALVLVVSRGLSNSGAVDLITRTFVSAGRSVSSHITIMASLGAAMSALMNNVGALALLMPVDIQAAEKAKRSPAITLMPLSFATILGGLITLIGTPPNIIISSYRAQEFGAPFKMFDYAPVGLACAAAGVAFVALIGWRLLPKATRERQAGKELFETGSYLIELRVGEDSDLIGKTIHQLRASSEKQDVGLVAVVRGNLQLTGFAIYQTILKDDVLLVETDAKSLDAFVNAHKLDYGQAEDDDADEADEPTPTRRRISPIRTPEGFAAEKQEAPPEEPDDGGRGRRGELALLEAVVRENSPAEGRTAQGMDLQGKYGVWLVGISRQGRQITRRVRHMYLRAGDILLLMGPERRLHDASEQIGALPLAARGLKITDHGKAAAAAGAFAAAVAAASFGLVYLPVALAAVVIAYVFLKVVNAREVYESVEWPVVVLIGSLLPIGAALESSGGTTLIANSIVSLSEGLPAWAVLTIIMVVTMTLSDILNNTATAVIAAPVAVGVAKALGVNADPFLMAVAVAASCAFLTPIGHKNNTLIMGPGGYRFGDYWRMGLPLEIVVIAVAVPVILMVWPL